MNITITRDRHRATLRGENVGATRYTASDDTGTRGWALRFDNDDAWAVSTFDGNEVEQVGFFVDLDYALATLIAAIHDADAYLAREGS